MTILTFLGNLLAILPKEETGLSLFQVHIGVQRLGALGPLAVGAGICLQDRDHYGATIIASQVKMRPPLMRPSPI
jgi:hypothetical protein